MNLLNITKNKEQVIVRSEILFDLPGNQSRELVKQIENPERHDYVESIHVFDSHDGFIIVSMKTGDEVVFYNRLPKRETNYVCHSKPGEK